jgi:uncharacterized protein (TIGR03083 family)
VAQVQDRYRLVSSGFDAAVRAVGPDKWEAQSPCEQWTARDLVAHVVEGHRSLIAGIRGGEPEPLGPEEDPTLAWEEVSQVIVEIAGEPETAAKVLDVHTWDLARTVGADERLDEDSVRQAYEDLKPMDAMIRQATVFGPKLDPPTDADLQTEFLYFLGRRA